MARVFLAGPQYAPHERTPLTTLEVAVRALGHHAVLPDGPSAPQDLRRAFRFHLQALDSCDAVVAILEGSSPDPETSLLVGYAYAARRPVLCLRGDGRGDAETGGLPRLVRSAVVDVARVPEWTQESLAPLLGDFLGGVRVFAGTLVRDAVPRILEDEGRPLRFRNVNPEEYPAVLKRKLVETARRLEEAEWGLEQEEIADVLELLETLINLRKYDKESLRSIKEGKWRKRGGYERGFLLEEEPRASSG